MPTAEQIPLRGNQFTPATRTGASTGEGALLQNAALGAEDGHIYETVCATHNAYIQPPFKRATPGALEAKTKDITIQPGKGNRITIDRQGDMIGQVYIEITLPVLDGVKEGDTWLPFVGYLLLGNIDLFLDDVELASASRIWYYIHDQLFTPDDSKRALDLMVGRNPLSMTVENTIIIPMKFFNSKRFQSRQLFLPSIASQHSDLIIQLDCEQLSNCTRSTNANFASIKTLDARLIVDYVFLSRNERSTFITQPYPIITEVVKDVEAYSYKETTSATGFDELIPSNRVDVDLSSINFPVKYLAFVANSRSDLRQKQFLNFLDVFEDMTLKFDGIDRERNTSPEFYKKVHEYYFAKRTTQQNIFFYSFSLDPGSIQPSGHYSFSNVKKPILQLRLKESRNDIEVHVYAVGYRVIEFIGGAAKIRFI